MIGLDSAGKTTILYNLKLGCVVQTMPTIGFNVESIEYRNIEFTVWDMGGQDKIRSLWRHYFFDTQGIIYVIDISDIERLQDNIIEFGKITQEIGLKSIPILIFANKFDLPNTISLSDISNRLNLNLMTGRKWHLQLSSGLTGVGIYEGLDWLSKNI